MAAMDRNKTNCRPGTRRSRNLCGLSSSALLLLMLLFYVLPEILYVAHNEITPRGTLDASFGEPATLSSIGRKLSSASVTGTFAMPSSPSENFRSIDRRCT